MQTSVIYGLLIPFVGTSLGSACVFFLKKGLGDRVQRGLTGFASGVMVAASIWSLLIPAMDQSAGGRDLGLPAGGHWLLGWYSLSAGVGSSDPSPPPKEFPRGRAPYAAAALHHDGTGGYPP